MTFKNVDKLEFIKQFLEPGQLWVKNRNSLLAKHISEIEERAKFSLNQAFEKVEQLLQEASKDIVVVDKNLSLSANLYNKINTIIKASLSGIDITSINYQSRWVPLDIKGKKYEISFDVYPGGNSYLKYKIVK